MGAISLWAMTQDNCPPEIEEALSLIYSISCYELPVWTEAEAEKYHIGENVIGGEEDRAPDYHHPPT